MKTSILDLFIDRMTKVAQQESSVPLDIESRSFSDPFERPTYLRHLDPEYKPREKAPKQRFTVDELAEGATASSDWRTWYTRHSDMLRLMFGADHELFKSLLALTSPNQSVPGNISMALRAYKNILLGKPIDASTGFMVAHSNNINRMLHGMGVSGPKVTEFEKAMFGDPNAAPIDLHMLEAIYGKNDKSGIMVGPAPNLPLAKYSTDVVRQVANKLNWNSQETQAAIWAFNFELRKQAANHRTIDPESFDSILAKRADDVYTTVNKGVITTHPPINEQIDELLDQAGGPYIEKVRPDKFEQFKQEQRGEFADTEANIGDIVGDIPVKTQESNEREGDIESPYGRRKS